MSPSRLSWWSDVSSMFCDQRCCFQGCGPEKKRDRQTATKEREAGQQSRAHCPGRSPNDISFSSHDHVYARPTTHSVSVSVSALSSTDYSTRPNSDLSFLSLSLHFSLICRFHHLVRLISLLPSFHHSHHSHTHSLTHSRSLFLCVDIDHSHSLVDTRTIHSFN